jgi:hypothetical protein
MRIGAALESGLAGACALTLLHESARRSVPEAPRVHVIGKWALRRISGSLGLPVRNDERLFRGALAGELASNTL